LRQQHRILVVASPFGCGRSHVICNYREMAHI